MSADVRRAAVEEFAGRLRQRRGEEGLQFVPLAGIAKADFGYMAVHPDLRRIQQLGQELAATTFGTCLTPVYAFLSMSEVSEYMSASGRLGEAAGRTSRISIPPRPSSPRAWRRLRARMAAYAEARVHPQLPR